jgi:lycopene cyclase CruA
VMARRYGYRVLVFDRGEIGCAHREWNISDRELQALVEIGLFTADELEHVVMRRYRDGIVRFSPDHADVRSADLHLPDVLNVALDATALLQLARRKLHAAGGTILDHRSFERVLIQQPGKLAVDVSRSDGARECYGGRVLLDGMGATSPLALQRFAGQPFAGVCPTVGTVVTGLEHGDQPDQHNPDLGDILVSIADAQRDRQLIWEGFPGRDDELTVYVFYYDVLRHQESEVRNQKSQVRSHEHLSSRHSSLVTRHSLLDLFEDYFRLLPTYKRPGSDFRHVKPVYGFIPSRHTQRRQTVPLLPGVLPVGDSSAQQSPLTFCGFGSHVRNLDRTTSLLDHALRHDLLGPDQLRNISAYQANVALNWVFSRFMQPWGTPRDVNQLQNVFARVLNEIGVDVAVRFFQDQMTWRDYGRIVNHTLRVYKPIITTALRVLGPRDTARWIADWLRFSGAAAAATLGQQLGPARLAALQARLDAARPAWGFTLRSRRAEWRTMGWERVRSS